MLDHRPRWCADILQVVGSTEDIPVRCFSSWQAAYVGTAGSTDTMDPVDATT